MGTVASFTNISATLPQPPAAVVTTTSDLVSTRLTASAAPAPLANASITDNQRSSAQVITASASESRISASSSYGASGSISGNLSTSGDSSSFLAQLYSQTDTTSNAAATEDSHFAPAPEYNTFVGYSFIKYQPSAAGVPQPKVSFSPTSKTISIASLAASEPITIAVPAAVTQTPAVAENTVQADTVQTTAPAPSAPSPAISVQQAVSTTAAVPAKNDNASLPVQPANDYQAYNNTQSRNQSNLAPATEPQIVIAG